ncbi:preprotein translocase subunit SecY [bacterium]|jgi:preprotein translocase subunit SecY|nr:preprotein translocase subunit SecY [bacterium]
MDAFGHIFRLPDLRKRFFFTLAMIAVYRLGSHVPIAGVDLNALKELFSQGGILSFVDLFSGGALGRFSIFALGILPYINASIIMQMLTFIWPKLKDLTQEGDAGRKQIAQYTRYLAIGLAIIQGIVMSVGFRAFILPDVNVSFFIFYAVIGLVSGAALVMFIGEIMTEYGIGNGASLLIFVGIISQIPYYIKNTVTLLSGGTSPLMVVIMVAILIFMIISIVFVQDGQRKVQVQYAKRVVGRKMMGGQSTFIPLRLIQGGVLPIIFASALLQFPMVLGNFTGIPAVQNFFSVYYRYDGVIYNGFFCILIFFFTYFYTAISFNPKELAENIKKYGGFILGVRPGRPTEEYLERIVTKLTFVGASFLAFVALLPVIGASMTKVTSFSGLGGTAILIIVGVALDFVKQIETYLLSRRYEGLID